MQPIIAGMTGAQFLGALNNLRKEFNVKDYGAVGNGITDDTEAIQAAINAAFNEGGGVVYIPKGVYIIGGALQHDIGGLDYNSQLYIPQSSYALRRTIAIIGEVTPHFDQTFGIGGAIPPLTGVVLRSTITSEIPYSYVIAGIGEQGTYGYFNMTCVVIENIQIQTQPDASNRLNVGGLGFNDGTNCVFRNVTVAPYNLNLVNSAEPINPCIGICMPALNCEIMNIVQNCGCGGFTSGFKVGDHTSLYDAQSYACVNAIEVGENLIMASATRIMSHYCKNAVLFSGGLSTIHIQSLALEDYVKDKWYDLDKVVVDPNNYGRGTIHYAINFASTLDNSKFSKTGGEKLICMPIGFPSATSFTVTGKRNDGTALESLLSKLEEMGIIIDNSTAS